MAGTTETSLAQYELVTHTLANGLELIVNPDPMAAGVAVNLWYRVGSRDEVAGRTGFAHLFEHLMFQGTWTGVNAGEHLAALQSAGAQANATTSFDRTNYFETVHPGALELALWLEAQRMGHLRVDQVNLVNQRDVVKEEKRQRYDNTPYGQTFAWLMELVYGSDGVHAYDHTPIGSMEDLDAAALEDVQAFFERWYAPSNASLVLAGNITVEDAITLVEMHFGDLAAAPRPDRPEITAPQPPESPRRMVKTDTVPRASVTVAWLIPPFTEPEAQAIDLGLQILASSLSARLYSKLVRELELAEHVSAGTMGLAAGSDLALLMIRPREGVSPEVVEAAALDELATFATEGPTDEELDRSRAQLERAWLSHLASIDDRADEINQWAVLGGDPELINSRLEVVNSITAEQITGALTQWLHPQHRSTLVILPEEDA